MDNPETPEAKAAEALDDTRLSEGSVTAFNLQAGKLAGGELIPGDEEKRTPDHRDSFFKVRDGMYVTVTAYGMEGAEDGALVSVTEVGTDANNPWEITTDYLQQGDEVFKYRYEFSGQENIKHKPLGYNEKELHILRTHGREHGYYKQSDYPTLGQKELDDVNALLGYLQPDESISGDEYAAQTRQFIG